MRVRICVHVCVRVYDYHIAADIDSVCMCVCGRARVCVYDELVYIGLRQQEF